MPEVETRDQRRATLRHEVDIKIVRTRVRKRVVPRARTTVGNRESSTAIEGQLKSSIHVHRASSQQTVRGDFEIAIQPSAPATIPSSEAMVDRRQRVVAQSWLLYKQIAGPGQSPEAPEISMPRDGSPRRWLQIQRSSLAFKRNALRESRRVRRNVLDSASVPRQTARRDAGQGLKQ